MLFCSVKETQPWSIAFISEENIQYSHKYVIYPVGVRKSAEGRAPVAMQLVQLLQLVFFDTTDATSATGATSATDNKLSGKFANGPKSFRMV